ncbi:MAG: hypothetical protein A2418_02385 [Candidatus Brennerbacteria bacterium RIFOXYC1_FULL_41_11]|uniref:histidine kinase n=1 Tax=Candidatus Brennerbacteria bacterium RIFOXYD1_FULL_41_16 TaxID=1797529 RepID=A0A1G1XJ73_9BACT|nr:MAG: hypothetical protein A2418_02385 [Candidatus Brennerbacteria bacterium RIFOXYC1_FULL_41_11]OGY40185.1 MAG: hypothetical protein A2570_02765 [Candidatus Brennerbacteria bacterium RIFOXYD1_FULL_41_16]
MFVGGARQKVARRRSGFWLYFSYIFSLFLISVLILGSGFVLIRFVSGLENNSRLVNLAGGQRTLAQDILNISLQLASNKDSDTQVLKKHLNLSFNTFVDNQKALEERNPDLELGGKNSDIIDAFLSEIKPDYQGIVSSALIVKSRAPGDPVVFSAVREMIRFENDFSIKMDRVVSQYELESKEKVLYAESLAIVIAGVILGVIFSEALFIFWPLSQRINRTIFETERFRLAVENTSDAVIIFNKNGSAIYSNETLEHFTGFSEYELLGERFESQRFWGDLIEPDFFDRIWDQVFEKKEKFSGELIQKNKVGMERDLKVSFFPVLNKRSRVEFLVGILRDITSEKEIDRAKSEFVSLASHQMKSPLSKTKWLTESLLAGDSGKFNEEQDCQLKEIYESNQRMIDLVNGLLDVSRIELGVFKFEPQLVNVSEVVRTVLSEVEVQAKKKNLRIVQFIQEGLPQIESDQKLIRIIFQNLISNAVKYTGNNGFVEITVKIAKKDQVFDQKPLKEDSLFISVKDNGVGIPENQKDKIFSKLFRADNVRMMDVEGTGLGLYVVKSIINKIGGEIWFESSVSTETVSGTGNISGTAFYVLMPLHQKQ